MSDYDFESSDDEQLAWADAQKYKLPFGEFSGLTLLEMLQTGKRRHKLRYYLQWDKLRPVAKANIEVALKFYQSLKLKKSAE